MIPICVYATIPEVKVIMSSRKRVVRDYDDDGAGAGAGAGMEAVSRSKSVSHACEEDGCDYVATKSSSLKRHMMIHTGDRPFVCEEKGCDYAAAQNGTLQKHIKRKHSKPTILPAVAVKAKRVRVGRGK